MILVDSVKIIQAYLQRPLTCLLCGAQMQMHQDQGVWRCSWLPYHHVAVSENIIDSIIREVSEGVGDFYVDQLGAEEGFILHFVYRRRRSLDLNPPL